MISNQFGLISIIALIFSEMFSNSLNIQQYLFLFPALFTRAQFQDRSSLPYSFSKRAQVILCNSPLKSHGVL